MNQEKIGKYIKEKRKNKKITQEVLAEKLGVSNKAVSNWENGKNMPDLSLFKSLCDLLDITINELLSGEDISDEVYLDKFEENIINVINNNNKNKYFKSLVFIISISIILFVILLFLLVFFQVSLDYEYVNITCEGDQNYIRIKSRGESRLYMTYRKIDDIYYRIYNSKISLIDIPSDYKTHINDYSLLYIDTFENIYDRVHIYYSDNNIDKLNKLDDKDFIEEIDNFNLICLYE